MEGVILTMNQGAVDIFGYNKEELIGKKRVSIFSPGEIVLQNVAEWLKKAVKNGVYEGKTYFLSKDNKKINAKIRITPTFSDGLKSEQTGYCGVTEVIDENVNVKINLGTKIIKWLAITRLPFTSVSILPVLVIAAYFSSVGNNLFSPLLLVLSLVGVLLAHLALNMFNDYYDVKDGTDDANAEYFQQLSGGSRSVELGLITLKKTKEVAIILTLLAVLFGLVILLMMNNFNLLGVISVSLAGLFLGYFYTAPPLRLVSRRGLGEISIFLAFGPLLTLGTGFAIYSGEYTTFISDHLYNILVLGVPLGLLTTNILLINQFPDANSDKLTGKNHLVVTFGKKRSRWIYASIIILTFFASLTLPVNINLFTIFSSFFVFSLAIYLIIFVFKNYKKRSLITSNWLTIALHAIYSVLLILTLLF